MARWSAPIGLLLLSVQVAFGDSPIGLSDFVPLHRGIRISEHLPQIDPAACQDISPDMRCQYVDAPFNSAGDVFVFRYEIPADAALCGSNRCVRTTLYWHRSGGRFVPLLRFDERQDSSGFYTHQASIRAVNLDMRSCDLYMTLNSTCGFDCRTYNVYSVLRVAGLEGPRCTPLSGSN